MTYKYTKEQIKDTVEGLGYKYFTGDNYDVNIIGISIKDNKSNQEKRVLKLTQNSCKHISCNPPIEEDVIVFDDYVGPGYAMPTDGMRDALSLMATKEAILLDPVYTGKAFDGLINLVKKNYFNSSDRVLEKYYLLQWIEMEQKRVMT